MPVAVWLLACLLFSLDLFRLCNLLRHLYTAASRIYGACWSLLITLSRALLIPCSLRGVRARLEPLHLPLSFSLILSTDFTLSRLSVYHRHSHRHSRLHPFFAFQLITSYGWPIGSDRSIDRKQISSSSSSSSKRASARPKQQILRDRPAS